MKMHRGRLIDHLHMIVRDLAKSRKFYTAALAALGIPEGGHGPEYVYYDELFISSTRFDKNASQPTGPVHLAFQAGSRELVEKFHQAGLAAGGVDDGAPGERAHYHPGYYGAFLLDPDGNFIEATYHGPALRSAASVEIEVSRLG